MTPSTFLSSLRPLIADDIWWESHWDHVCENIVIDMDGEADPGDAVASGLALSLDDAELDDRTSDAIWDRLDWLVRRAEDVVDMADDPQAVALRIVDTAIQLARCNAIGGEA